MSEHTSNTRRCAKCHEPKTLGVVDCDLCGSVEWEWIDPTRRAARPAGKDDER